jgi:putative transposase
MPRPWRVRYPGAKYHVTCRGNGRARIFLCETDYRRFLHQLEEALGSDKVVLFSYCLMPNHIHLHLETPHANLSRFMQRLTTAYAMYFRYKKHRPGHCFQGRYGAKVVDGDEYHLRLTRYIHRNPIETRRFLQATQEEGCAALSEYAWSSHGGYSGLTEPEPFIDYRWLELMGCRTLGGNRRRYKRYIEGFHGEDELLGAAMGASRYAIGDERFVETTEDEVRSVMRGRAVDGDIVWPERKKLEPEVVIRAVADAFGVPADLLAKHGGRSGLSKMVAVELCSQMTGLTNRALAPLFGYRDGGGVGKLRQRLAARLQEEPAVAAQLERIRRDIA